jgi:hypothetical protein
MPGKRVRFDDATWHALDQLAKDRMQAFQELADEAFADLLRKHGRPTDLKTALRQSVMGMDKRPPARSVTRGDGRQQRQRSVIRMGVRTRGPDIKAAVAKFRADRAAREEAAAVVDRWNWRLATGRDMLWSPTIRAAMLAGTPWLDVILPGFTPSCGPTDLVREMPTAPGVASHRGSHGCR